jgi:hypothetical protein
MIAQLRFVTWPLLIGVVAAAIPFALHLLSSVRAREVYFPTLRFLQISMEKTARRRRIQHWLLLLLRAALLAVLAVGVAEPIYELAAAEDTAAGRYAAAIIIDNSLSMAARNAPPPGREEAPAPTRLDRAKAEAAALLEGEEKPALACAIFTNPSPPQGGEPPAEPQKLTSDPGAVLAEIGAQAEAATVEADLPGALRRAIKLLDRQREVKQQRIYVFSDLQKTSFEDLHRMRDLARARGVRLVFVSAVEGEVHNASVAEVKVTGRAVAGEPLGIEARLRNSSPTEMTATARLLINDQPVEDREVSVKPAGAKGEATLVSFSYTPEHAGPLTGEVVLSAPDDRPDDLSEDDRRRFSLEVRDRARVLVVHGPLGRADPPDYAPAASLLVALQPFAGSPRAWPIVLRPPDGVPARQFAADDLAGMDAAFFCDVGEFSPEQVQAVARFTRDGGTVAFFLGPNVDGTLYNALLRTPGDAASSLLPGELGDVAGLVDPGAGDETFATPLVTHRFFTGLYKDPADYPLVEVRRHFRLASVDSGAEVAMRHAPSPESPDGDPIILTKPLGLGRVILCTTTASPVWSNLASRPIFLPMVFRMSLPPSGRLGRDNPPGSDVVIRPRMADPPADATVLVELPDGSRLPAVGAGGEGDFVFPRPMLLGTYRWEVSGAGDQAGAWGSFVVNPQADECDLQAVDPEAFKRDLAARGVKGVYVGASVPGTQALGGVRPEPPKEQRWWDLLLAVVILLLVVEAVVANSFRRREETAIPAHVNPRLAG